MPSRLAFIAASAMSPGVDPVASVRATVTSRTPSSASGLISGHTVSLLRHIKARARPIASRYCRGLLWFSDAKSKPDQDARADRSGFSFSEWRVAVQNSGMAESGGSTSAQWFGPLNEYVGSATASFVG